VPLKTLIRNLTSLKKIDPLLSVKEENSMSENQTRMHFRKIMSSNHGFQDFALTISSPETTERYKK